LQLKCRTLDGAQPQRSHIPPQTLELLLADGALVGRVSNLTLDMPWFEGVFEQGPAWPQLAPTFATALKLLEEDRIDELSTLWAELLNRGLHLADGAGGVRITEFMLHTDGRIARFRY
jgi:hypothetical protein